MQKNAARLDAAIDYKRDYEYNIFGIRTLERSYLLRINNRTIERPQQLLMRVAIGIHGANIDEAIATYNLLSQRYFTHATPTLYAACKPKSQMSSCFLLSMVEDSMEGILETFTKCCLISKSGGGIGINVHCIRAAGCPIYGTGGISDGLVPMLRVLNNMCRFARQGIRPGAFAVYLEPWHADIFEFLSLKKNTGAEEHRARDLFYALWIPDLFMRRVEADEDWSLMCPNEKDSRLDDVWGDDFERLYLRYEANGKAVRKVRAQALWFAIIESQVETGTPYMMYKDACNRKSNQQNLGTIRCSNLCTEIVQYSSKDEIAVCNLASIALNMFVDKGRRTYDFLKLKETSKIVTRNLNKIIDANYYPLPQTKLSNMRHRPIGLGVQGLADAFILMRMPYESPEAQLLNKQIFETLYYGALEASCELAQTLGPYESYAGSPVSKGILQYDMWNVTPTDLWDWNVLKAKIAIHGVRNSLLIAPMPTAATAQILGNNEAFEPYTSNIYNRRVLSGDFQVVNQHLVADLTELGLWNDDMRNHIIYNGGSIQAIDTIPLAIRQLYKTVWEISVKTQMNMAADRGAFIDQSQSFNIHVAQPNYGKLTSIHFYGWKLGLKTGMYYLRTKPAADPIQFTVDKSRIPANSVNEITAENGAIKTEIERLDHRMADMVCSLQNKEDCLSCGS